MLLIGLEMNQQFFSLHIYVEEKQQNKFLNISAENKSLGHLYKIQLPKETINQSLK